MTIKEKVQFFASVLIALVAVFVDYDIFNLGKEVKELQITYYELGDIISFNKHTNHDTTVTKKLKLFYLDTIQIRKILTTNLQIKNIGNKPIVKNDIKDSLLITFPNSTIIDTCIASGDANSYKVSLNKVNSSIHINLDILNAMKSFTLNTTVIIPINSKVEDIKPELKGVINGVEIFSNLTQHEKGTVIERIFQFIRIAIATIAAFVVLTFSYSWIKEKIDAIIKSLRNLRKQP